MKERLCDEGGNIRRFVNIYLNDEDIRFLDGKATAVADGAEISIIPAIAAEVYLNGYKLARASKGREP